jgi:hypothetical protein
MRGARSTRTFREALRGIPIAAPFSLEQFCESISEQRGKRVAVIPVPWVSPAGSARGSPRGTPS